MENQHFEEVFYTCFTQTFSAVDEDHGDDGQVPLGFDLAAVVEVELVERVVVRVEDEASEGAQFGEDVTRARRVFACSLHLMNVDIYVQ